MIKEYSVAYNDEENVQWDEIEGAIIKTPLRGRNNYQTEAVGKIVYSANKLRIYMKAYEQHIHATYLDLNSDVSRDSCLEFFIKPNADDPRYLNFEFNPFGALLIGIGSSAYDRRRLNEINPEVFHIRTRLFSEGERNCWSVSFEIPNEVMAYLMNCKIPIKKLRGCGMTCNFMKCGNHGDKFHQLIWSENGDASEGFHNSELFGKLNFLA